MAKKVKKYIVPGTALIASSYISLPLALGGVIGYLGTNFFCKKFIETEKIKPVTLGVGSWEIHLHHWITGSLAIVAIFVAGLSAAFPIAFIGVLGGLAFHDLHTDKGWYKVIYKKK